jgi:hypothetical protein
MEETYCKMCLESFKYKSGLHKHLNPRKNYCIEREQKIKELLVAQKTYYEEIIKNPSTNNERKKFNIPDVFKVLQNSDISVEKLMKVSESGTKRNVKLIEKLLFTSRPKEEWGIKLIDYSRQKYQIFTGNPGTWINVTIDDITENFMIQMSFLFDRVILQKNKELDEVNKKYPYFVSDEFAQKNIIDSDIINEKYTFSSNYRLSLLSGMDEYDLFDTMKNRLKNLFNKYL